RTSRTLGTSRTPSPENLENLERLPELIPLLPSRRRRLEREVDRVAGQDGARVIDEQWLNRIFSPLSRKRFVRATERRRPVLAIVRVAGDEVDQPALHQRIGALFRRLAESPRTRSSGHLHVAANVNPLGEVVDAALQLVVPLRVRDDRNHPAIEELRE